MVIIPTRARPTTKSERWIVRNTRRASPWLQGAPQRKAAATTSALPAFHIKTPREALMTEATAITATLRKATLRPRRERNKRYPPKPRDTIQETIMKFWKRPALTKTEVGR